MNPSSFGDLLTFLLVQPSGLHIHRFISVKNLECYNNSYRHLCFPQDESCRSLPWSRHHKNGLQAPWLYWVGLDWEQFPVGVGHKALKVFPSLSIRAAFRLYYSCRHSCFPLDESCRALVWTFVVFRQWFVITLTPWYVASYQGM